MALFRSSLNLANSVEASLDDLAIFTSPPSGSDSTGHLSQLLYPSAMLLSFKTFETETFGTERSGSFRAPTTCSVRGVQPFPRLLWFTCVPFKSYSSPGSFAVTLVAIGLAPLHSSQTPTPFADFAA